MTVSFRPTTPMTDYTSWASPNILPTPHALFVWPFAPPLVGGRERNEPQAIPRLSSHPV